MAGLVPLATFGDLDDLLDIEITDEDRAEALLAAASTLVRAHTGSAWVDADGNLEWEDATDEKLLLVGDALSGVTVAAAGRAYLNPTGGTQKTVGDVSISYGSAAASGVYLTDDEKATLTRAVGIYRGTTSPGLWTLSTTRLDDADGPTDLGVFDERTGTYYLGVTPDGQDLPWLDVSDLNRVG